VNKLDKHHFEQLFREFFPPLCHFAKKFIGDLDAAKDLVHEVFINLWEKRDELDTDKPLKSYLYTAVHNRSLNYLRDHRRFVRQDLPAGTPQLMELIESKDHLEQEELMSEIRESLASLPEKCREIFLLNRFDGLKYREIAEELDISIKTVETQMSRAMKRMRERLIRYLTVLIILLLIIG
jgi:RNA polymerase sigma-70 factor (ECF subfamily)